MTDNTGPWRAQPPAAPAWYGAGASGSEAEEWIQGQEIAELAVEGWSGRAGANCVWSVATAFQPWQSCRLRVPPERGKPGTSSAGQPPLGDLPPFFRLGRVGRQRIFDDLRREGVEVRHQEAIQFIELRDERAPNEARGC